MFFYAMSKFRILILLASLSAFAVSCSTVPVELDSHVRETNLKSGDNAHLSWKFRNADSVVFDDLDLKFNPEDSIYVSPEDSRAYNITAYNESGEKLTVQSHVNVFGSDQIQRGPVALNSSISGPSFVSSEYLNGQLEVASGSLPARIKIMRRSINNDNTYTANVLVMDNLGNYLHKTNDVYQDALWQESRAADQAIVPINDILEIHDIDIPLNIAVMIDVSASNKQEKLMFKSVNGLINNLQSNDQLMLSAFNQKFQEVMPLTPAEQALYYLQEYTAPLSDGLNSINKAIFTGLDRLSGGDSPRKAAIVITTNSDNSSVIYTPNDVAKLAMEYNIPIYIVAVGYAMETYSLKYMADITGGRFYHIGYDELEYLPNILTEISFGQRHGYEMIIPVLEETSQDMVNSVVKYSGTGFETHDKSRIILNPYTQYSRYQSVANFDYRDTTISPDFNESLNSLASVLKDNPTVPLELIGHSSVEGSDQENMELSLSRASSVKAYLVSRGVSPDQLQIKGEGNHLPVFYLQSEAWQQYYNRRVVLRWLDPSVYPYEIEASMVESEEVAMTEIDNWERRGYMAYYDRYLKNDITFYRVKIWGFATETEAKKTARTLKRRFKGDFVVD